MRLGIQQASALVLTQGPGAPNDPGGQGPDFGKSSPVGLLLVILLGVAVVFLIRSMTKHLRKLPTTFDADRAAAAAPQRSSHTAKVDEREEEQSGPAEAVPSDPGERRRPG
jgi:hypothetical protein